LGRKPTLEELEAFALGAIEQINQRTLDGQTVSGGRFAPYSESYAEKKGVSRSSVDLFLEGDMLGSLDYELDESKGTVNILLEGDEAAKGYNHHVGDTLPRRPWFGLVPGEVEAIAEAIIEAQGEGEEDEGITLGDLMEAISQVDFEVD
jgi:hypothetical protein